MTTGKCGDHKKIVIKANDPVKVATPAKAGVQCFCNHPLFCIPAFAGMTFDVDFGLITSSSKLINNDIVSMIQDVGVVS